MKKILIILFVILIILCLYLIIFYITREDKVKDTNILNDTNEDIENNIQNNIDKKIYTIDRYKLNNEYEETHILKEANKENCDGTRIYKQILDSIYQYEQEIYISEDVDLMWWMSQPLINNIFARMVVNNFEVSEDGHYIYVEYTSKTKEEHDNKIIKAENKILDLIEYVEEENYNEFEKVLFVYSYWAKNISYDYDLENMPSYEDMLLHGRGVCQNYSRAIEYTLNQMNIEVYDIGGDANGAHSWNLVKIYDDYYHLDATFEKGGDTLGAGLRYFGLSDKDMLEKENRTFDNSYTELGKKATSQKLDKLREAYSYRISDHTLILYDRDINVIGTMDTTSLLYNE